MSYFPQCCSPTYPHQGCICTSSTNTMSVKFSANQANTEPQRIFQLTPLASKGIYFQTICSVAGNYFASVEMCSIKRTNPRVGPHTSTTQEEVASPRPLILNVLSPLVTLGPLAASTLVSLQVSRHGVGALHGDAHQGGGPAGTVGNIARHQLPLRRTGVLRFQREHQSK